MAKPNVSDHELARLINTYGVAETAIRLGYNARSLHRRRRNIEKELNLRLSPPTSRPQNNRDRERWAYQEHEGRVYHEVRDGVVIVGGDFHYEPGHIPVMHRAMVHLCRELKPVGVIANGDVCDFARISRFPKISDTDQPHPIKAEVECAQERLGEIEKSAFRAWKDWPLGNHDKRYNQTLATIADDPRVKEFIELWGNSLKDHFPLWTPCWAVHINPGTEGFTIVQHRNRGGEHSAYRNAKEMHCHYVTGHDHHPYVRGYRSARSRVFGINHGMIADIEQQVFVNYTESRPLNWSSALAVLVYRGGLLMPPELCEKIDDRSVWFRGQVIMLDGTDNGVAVGEEIEDALEDDEDMDGERKRWHRNKKRMPRKRHHHKFK